MTLFIFAIWSESEVICPWTEVFPTAPIFVSMMSMFPLIAEISAWSVPAGFVRPMFVVVLAIVHHSFLI